MRNESEDDYSPIYSILHHREKSWIIPYERFGTARGPPMAEDPERISYRYIVENADQHYLSSDHLWMMWIWRNIVLVRPSGKWSVYDTTFYLNQYWNIFGDLKQTYSKVYFVFDMNQWEMQTEEFRRYIKENWAHTLDREDLNVLFVDSSSIKRLIWSAMFQLVGKRELLFIFKDFSEAFAWIRGRFVKNGV